EQAERLKSHAQDLGTQTGRPYEYLSHAARKEGVARKSAERVGVAEGRGRGDCGGPGVRCVGGGAVPYVLAGLERWLTVRAVDEAQVSPLLLLLPGPRPWAHPRQAPELVPVSDPDLRQRPRVAGSATRSSRHQVHEARQCVRAAERR